MSIPTKIVINGDKVAGYSFVGDGHRQMLLLENAMEFQGLEQYTSLSRPAPGVLIKCSKVFGLRTMEITTKGGGGDKSEKSRECYCFPHFSMGIIKKIYPEQPTYEDMRRNRFKYDIDVCKGKGYVLKKEIFSAGWERYYVGQYVLVTIGAKLDKPPVPDFDQDRNCLMQQPQFDVLTVSPFYFHGKMQKWATPKE